MDKIIFTTILVVFPFGQLLKFGQINLFDVLVSLLAVWTILKKPKYPSWYGYFLSFLIFAFFTWIFNFFIIKDLLTLKGLLYLFRLGIYSFVGVYLFNIFTSSNKSFLTKKWLMNAFVSISTLSAFFGWVQYILLPDTRFLKNFGWDDHLYRMVGTFFDPTYLALIILLGIVVVIVRNKGSLSIKSQILLFFLVISLAFTYSRSTYLALFLFLLFKRKFLAIIVFIITILILPKMLSEGTNFARVVSAQNKASNYQETYQILKKSPVIGVGFNNLCLFKQKLDISSHSCFGADSSILLVLATTGIIGFMLFATFIFKVSYSKLLLYSFVLVLIHSQFANSLFYPHIMFWLFSLTGLGSVVKSNGSR